MATVTTRAYSSYMTFLMYKASSEASTYTKLCDVKTIPDMGDTPDLIDATTLSDPREWGVADIIKQGDALTFTVNYTPEEFKEIYALRGKQTEFEVWLGGTETDGVVTPVGDKGCFKFKGECIIRKTGAGVSEVQEAEIAIIPSEGPDFYESATAANS